MTAGDDRSLLLAWRSGDNRAGQTLIDRHHPAIRRTFLNEVGSEAEAEALALRTLAAAREGRVPLSNGDAVDTWLFAVARHVLLEWRDEVAGRRRSAQPEEV